MTATDSPAAILRRMGACAAAINWAKTQPDAETAWRQCERPDWMIWLARRRKVEHKTLVRSAPMNDEPFDRWAILELMGHVRLAGLVSEEELFGVKMGRIDIPNGDGFTTQYFGGGSVYRLTPTTEEIVRSVAARNQPQPAHRWELPAPDRDSGTTPKLEHSDADDGFHF